MAAWDGPCVVNNWVTFPSRGPPPTLYFATIDIANCYYNHELQPWLQQYCGFTTEWAEFQFVRLPYGVNFAPRYQQKQSLATADEVFKEYGGLPFWSMIILDDFIIASPIPGLPADIAVALRSALQAEGYVVHGANKSVGIESLATEAEWHGKLWRGSGDSIICQNKTDQVEALKHQVQQLYSALDPDTDMAKVPGEKVQSLIGKLCWLSFPALTCLPFLGKVYAKIHHEIVLLRKKDIDMIMKAFSVLITQPLLIPRTIGSPDSVFPCSHVWHSSCTTIITDFAEACDTGAIVLVCPCGRMALQQLNLPLVQGPGEVATFHNGMMVALNPPICPDTMCPSHNEVPTVLLGDNGTARRMNVFSGAIPYLSRRLARELAEINETNQPCKRVFYGWISGESNFADYFSRNEFQFEPGWQMLPHCIPQDLCTQECWL